MVAQGIAKEVTDPTERKRLRGLPLLAWSEDPDDDAVLQITPLSIRGERVTW